MAKQPIKVPNIANGIIINSSSISPDFFKGITIDVTLCNVGDNLLIL